MAAYPPGPSRLAVLPNYGANSAPADLLYIVSAAVGLNAGDASDRFITPNDFLETITRNITQKTLIFEDADGVRTVSAVNTGKIDYSVANQSFQVSENGGAYQNLVKGVGANTRVAYWTATDTLSSDSAFLWDETNDRLLISVSVASGVAPIDVMADALSVAQQWRENGAGTGRVQMQMGSGFGQLGTTVSDDFALMTNSLQRVNVEATGSTVFGSIVPATGQVMINSLTALTTGLVVNNAVASSVDIALFQVNSSNRAILTENSEWILGLAATVSGKLTMANSAGATLTSWSAGNAASTLNFIWPVVDPTANQVLRAAAPVAGDVTLSWATVVTGPALPIGSVQFNGGGVFDGDADLLWDDTAKQLLVGGLALGAGAAPIEVIADVAATAQAWEENGGGARVLMQVPSSFGQLGTVGTHDFALVTNSLQRLNIESGGAAVFGSIVPATAQVMINALTVNTVGLVVNNAAATNVDLAQFQINSSNRFLFTKNAEMIAGLAATIDGKVTLASAGAAFTQSLMAGAAPAATNAFRWPNADPTAGQALTASAPAAGVVTLSWTTVSGGTTINPTNTLIPYRSSSSAFSDSNLVRLSTTVTDLRDITTGTNAQSFRVYGTSDNGAADPTNYVRGTLFATSSAVELVAQSGGTGAANVSVTIHGVGNVGAVAKGGDNSGTFFEVHDNSANVYTRVNQTGTFFRNNLADLLNSGGAFNVVMASGRIIVSNSGSLDFRASVGGSVDLTLTRHAANVFRTTNGSTGIGSVLIGTSTDSLTGNFTVMSSNAATSSVVTVARLGVNSTGTAADNFGAALSFSAESSTTNDSETGRVNVFWTTASHANRTAAFSWSITNNTTLAEYMRLGVAALASPVVLSVHGGTNPNVWTSGSFAAKLYLIGASLPAVGVAAHFSATALDAPQWQMLRGRGTNASPTAIQASDSIGNIEWWGQTSTSTNNVVAGARIRVSATENWSAGNNGCQMIFFTSNNAGTITDRMYLKETGTLRVGATAGSYNTTTLVQVGGYSSWNTDVVGAIYTGANGTKGLEVIGTNGQTADLFRVYRDAVTPDTFKVTAAAGSVVRAGLGTASTDYAYLGGNLKTNTTAVGNVGTGEDNLITFSLPANTLGTDGDYVEIDAFGDFAANANNKTVKLYFGSTVLFDSTAFGFNGGGWRITGKVIRTGATAQIAIATYFGDATLVSSLATYTTPSETLSGAVTIKCTGTATSNDDIVQRGLTVRWYPKGQ